MLGWNITTLKEPHSGKYCYGKTPMQTFIDSIDLAKEKLIDSNNLVFGNKPDFSFSKAPNKEQVFEKEKAESIKTEISNFNQNLNDSK